MTHLRLALAAGRVVALLVVVAMFIKVAPTLASHAFVHAGTYSAPSAAAQPARPH
jgi:hypothetical protein